MTLISLTVFGPFAWAVAAYAIGRRSGPARDICAIVATATELILAAALAAAGGALNIDGALAGGLHFTTGGLHTAYALITALMWACTSAFGREYFAHEQAGLNRYQLFSLMTLGATEGVMLSADFMTAFVFFEILSLTSFTWVIHEQSAAAVRAGYTYLFIAVAGGLTLFMGLLLLWSAAGTLRFDELLPACAQADRTRVLAGGVCVLLGFGAKAGMFPLHVWLPKAHPVAPSPASALLSGVLTKVGVYGILMFTLYALPADRVFGLIILCAGVITMALGALLALFSTNLKRTLACSSMSQIGFILTGIAMSTLLGAAGAHEEALALARGGTVLHMVNHSLIKLTLFMAAGVVVMNEGKLELNAIRGWGRRKRLLKLAFALGALGISGVPLFNGYISKTLLHEAIVEGSELCAGLGGALRAVEWIFLCSGGLTFAYMLKLFICVFVERNSDPELQARFDAAPRCMNGLSAGVICFSALAMPLLGQPGLALPLGRYITGLESLMEFSAFSLGNLRGGAISLAIGAAVYAAIVRRALMKGGRYLDRWPRWLDMEEAVYRPLFTRALPALGGAVASLLGENKLLRPLCRALKRCAGEFAQLIADNRVTSALCRAAMVAGTVVGRALCDLPDFMLRLLRLTALREKRALRTENLRAGKLFTLREETIETARPLQQNFSFALLMTCVGLLLILGTLIILGMN